MSAIPSHTQRYLPIAKGINYAPAIFFKTVDPQNLSLSAASSSTTLPANSLLPIGYSLTAKQMIHVPNPTLTRAALHLFALPSMHIEQRVWVLERMMENLVWEGRTLTARCEEGDTWMIIQFQACLCHDKLSSLFVATVEAVEEGKVRAWSQHVIVPIQMVDACEIAICPYSIPSLSFYFLRPFSYDPPLGSSHCKDPTYNPTQYRAAIERDSKEVKDWRSGI